MHECPGPRAARALQRWELEIGEKYNPPRGLRRSRVHTCSTAFDLRSTNRKKQWLPSAKYSFTIFRLDRSSSQRRGPDHLRSSCCAKANRSTPWYEATGSWIPRPTRVLPDRTEVLLKRWLFEPNCCTPVYRITSTVLSLNTLSSNAIHSLIGQLMLLLLRDLGILGWNL